MGAVDLGCTPGKQQAVCQETEKARRREKEGKEERRQQGPLSRRGASERPRSAGAHVAYAGAAVSVGRGDPAAAAEAG